MNWKIAFNEKGNPGFLVVLIILIFAILIMIRYKNKTHVIELQESITTIYDDRLVAKSYIFELSKKIQSKKNLAESEDKFIESNIQMNGAIHQLIKKFESTKLTNEEELLLIELQSNIRISEQLENKLLINRDDLQKEMVTTGLLKEYNLILSDLEKLSEIQLSEGRKLLNSSYQIVASSNNTSQLEIALVIFFLLIILKIFNTKTKI